MVVGQPARGRAIVVRVGTVLVITGGFPVTCPWTHHGHAPELWGALGRRDRGQAGFLLLPVPSEPAVPLTLLGSTLPGEASFSC